MRKSFFLLLLVVLIPFITFGAEAICTLEYAPQCGQPPMPVCPVGMACIQSMPQPQTYGNSCMLKAAGATLIHTGECESSSPKACTKEYAPVCGMILVQCVTAPCDPVRRDFGNRCMAESAGAYDITAGTCEMSESSPPIVGGDRDSHGCIGSAGYSWDASLASCIRNWEYQPTVDWAYENKITKYSSLSEFKYGNTLTRQEAAAFVTRYLIDGLGREEAMCKTSYRDSSTIDTSLMPAISRACGMGVMFGNGGYFYPKMLLSKSQTLAILIRAIDGKKLDENITPWYENYKNRAIELGLSFGVDEDFETGITRGEFINWLQKLSDPSNNSDENLLGEWKLESLRHDDMVFAGSGQKLNFTTDRYSTRFCNSISGEYSAKNGKMTAGPAMSTMMACTDTTITTMEGLWNLDGATYTIASVRQIAGSIGPSIWLTITTRAGDTFTYTR